jgi:hypothetical protein
MRGGTHKRDAPGCRRHKRMRHEAKGVQQLAARAPHKEWREQATREDPPTHEAEAVGEAAAHDPTVSTEVHET